MKAYIFPGQGAQFPGMGKDLFENSKTAYDLYNIANEILGFRKLIAKFSKNPIDTSYLNFKDIDGFKRSCKIVKDLGFGGKACIHPNQIEISNEIFNEK